jgi:hypothetical protein
VGPEAGGRREEYFGWGEREARSSCGEFPFPMGRECGGVTVAREGDATIVGAKEGPSRELYCCGLADEGAVEGSGSEMRCCEREPGRGEGVRYLRRAGRAATIVAEDPP